MHAAEPLRSTQDDQSSNGYDVEAFDLLGTANQHLESLGADERIVWALDNLPGAHVLSSSFGIQAAVSLHMLTRHKPDIPVIFIDTGYLFPETYRFADELTNRLGLNLHVYQAGLSPAWIEARYGRLWEEGQTGLDRYNRLTKVGPMERALGNLGATSWFSGLRRDQSDSRRKTPILTFRNGRYKVHPLADWSNKDIWQYLKEHGLPCHPLWDEGYVSVGDIHTTQRWQPGMKEEETRFFGRQRECGLHTDI